ncbi:MAG: hydroxymethylbilane synthase [Actinobacteria bacterium]|nr:hydroxymethylbilane synthase [Actinomycetota bacterium]
MSGTLRIGSRGSRLALIQSEWVRDELMRLHPDLRVEIEVIQTKGDKLLDAPLAKLGDKGLFTKELEAAMLEGRTDLAVHSAKDMPTEVPEGLAIVAFTAREDVRDVFVGGSAFPVRSLDDLPRGATVGTSSLRRRSQLLALRPDLDIVDIRGNVQTRLRKLDEQGMAGTVLAAAGLARLEQPELASFAFAFHQMLPAVGQGSLALEARAGDARVAALVVPLIHERTTLALRAERSLMHALQGGCQVPIAGFAEVSQVPDELGAEQLRLRAFVGSVDGTKTVRGELKGPAQAPEGIGIALADDLLARGADQVLAEVRGAV